MIREYRDGDEVKILKLFKEVFGIERSLEYWNWQFKDPSQERSFIMVAEENNEIVGHAAFRANNINFLGKKIIAGQGCDKAIRVDQRGKNLGTQLSNANRLMATKNGIKATFGFPNRKNYPIGMRYRNSNRIAMLNYYYYRIGYAKLVGAKVDCLLKPLYGIPNLLRQWVARKRVGGNIKIVVSTKLDNDISVFLNEYLNFEVLSIWKDFAYMKWRYENHPEFKYKFHILYIDSQVIGMAVCRDKGKAVMICDFLHRERNISQAVLLLHHLVNHYLLSKAQNIEFNGWDNGFYESVFKQCQFSMKPSNINVTSKANDDERLEKMLIIPENWSISIGDSDVV